MTGAGRFSQVLATGSLATGSLATGSLATGSLATGSPARPLPVTPPKDDPMIHYVLTVQLLTLAGGAAHGEEIDSFANDWSGSGLVVEAFADPAVAGVTGHIVHFDRSVIDRLTKGKWFANPSNSAIPCTQTRPITIAWSIELPNRHWMMSAWRIGPARLLLCGCARKRPATGLSLLLFGAAAAPAWSVFGPIWSRICGRAGYGGSNGRERRFPPSPRSDTGAAPHGGGRVCAVAIRCAGAISAALAVAATDLRRGAVMAAAIAIAAMPGATAAMPDWAAARPVTVVTVEYRFEPNHLVFRHGVAYRLHVVNRGKELHELTAPKFFRAVKLRNPEVLNAEHTEIVVQPAEQKDLFFIASRPGHFAMWCADHDWAGMTGDITVK
jgi:uncharacterized cupredoxin-like copper-binding protein